MSLLLLWVGVPAATAILLVWGFQRGRRTRTPEWRAVAVAAPLAAAAGIAYAVEFPALLRQIHSSTAALSYLALPLLSSVVASAAFAVAWAGVFLVLDRRRELAMTAAAAALVALGGVVLSTAALLYRLEATARSPDSSPAELREVYAARERFAVAEAPVAAILLKTGSRDALAYLAVHPHCPEDVWLSLVADRDPAVSARALRNPAIPPEALRALSARATPAIRAGLAANPATPGDLLRAFARDGDVDGELSSNPALPEDAVGPVLARVAAMKDISRRAGVACSQRAPAKLLVALAADPEPPVRLCAASNRATPPETLAQLANDPDESVRSVARATLVRGRSRP